MPRYKPEEEDKENVGDIVKKGDRIRFVTNPNETRKLVRKGWKKESVKRSKKKGSVPHKKS